MRGLAWATALFVTSALGAAPPEAPEVYALVVGHNGGLPATTSRPALPSLRFADDDALRLARWFQMLGGADHVVVLTEPDDDTRATWRAAGLDVPATQAPTRANLFAAIDQLKAQLAARVSGRPAVLYFFYAGHGVTGRFLLKPEGALDAGLTGHELRVRLGELEVDRVELFVDACRAQSFFAERGAGPDLSAEIDELENRRRHPVFGVLTATQSDRPAGETSQLQGGFFSHVLASGLAGAADVNGDDVVGFGELAAFVAFNTEALTGQRPWFEAPGGDLSAPVVDLHGGPRLRLNAETHGRIRVLSATGVPVFAEMNKAAGRPARLVLPVGHYQVMQPLDGREARVTTVDLAAGEEREVPEFTAHSDRVASAATRGPTGEPPWAELAFQTPFSPQVVAALDAGYTSGREPSSSARGPGVWAVDAAYLLSPAPFGASGLEHGAELAVRTHLGHVMLGARLAARGASFATPGRGTASEFRLGFHLQGGWRFQWVDGLVSATVFALAGLKSVLVQSQGDLTAPSVGGGLRFEGALGRRFSLWLEGRYEAAWVRVDGTRSPFGEPAVSLGVSAWF